MAQKEQFQEHKEEGSITIKKSQDPKQNSSENKMGEYVDYEEIK